MKIGYVRVSTVEQNVGRQLVTMEKYAVDKIFQEKVSAKDTNRTELKKMLEFINNFYESNKQLEKKDRQELTLVIHDFSRLARSTKDLLELVEYFNQRNVTLISSKENIDTSTPNGKLLLTVLGAINEFERANMLERQAEGIAIAKAQGKYKGRVKKTIDKELFDINYKRFKDGEITKVQFAKELDVSRPTLDRMLKDIEG